MQCGTEKTYILQLCPSSYNNWAGAKSSTIMNVVNVLQNVVAHCYVEILHTTLKLKLQVEKLHETFPENPTAQWSQILWNETWAYNMLLSLMRHFTIKSTVLLLTVITGATSLLKYAKKHCLKSCFLCFMFHFCFPYSFCYINFLNNGDQLC